MNPLLAPNRTAAAGFILSQVVPSAVVACDAPTCAALTSGGFTGPKVQVGKDSTSLSNARLIVVTPELRTAFTSTNRSLGTDVAPVNLASWGSGSALVTVQVVDPNGAQDYVTAFNQAVQRRTNVGQHLASSGRVSGDKSDLAAGAADPRLLVIIKDLAVLERVDVVGFADSGPGASAGVPFRTMYLAEKDPLGQIAAAAYLKVIKNLLQAHANFPAAQVSQVSLGGQNVVRVHYAAPSPN